MQVGEMFVAVRPDTKGFDSELQSGVQQSGQRAQTSIGQYLTAGAAIAGVNALVGSASDLNEAVNVTGLIFDQSRASIDEFAEGSAQALGISETAARQATATFGGLLQNLGMTEEESAGLSMSLTTLASDMASAFNTEPADAALALASALRGETEPIRAYNVQLSDMAVRQEAVRLGLADSTAAVDANGLVQGRLSLIMAQTSAVQGDFANTATSAANAQRIAAAEAENASAAIGENFLPAYEQMVALAQGAARAFGALPGPIQSVAVLLGLLAATRGPVSTAFSGIGDSARAAAERFRQAGGGAAGLSQAITPGAMGTVAAAAGLAVISQGLADMRARQDAAKASTEALAEAFTQGGESGLADNLLTQIAAKGPDAVDALSAAGISARDLSEAAAEGNDALMPLVAALAATGLISTQTAVEIGTLAARSADGRVSADALSEAQDANAESTAAATGSMEDQAAALDSVADAASEARDMLDRLFGIEQTADEAALALQESSDALAESLRDHVAQGFDISTEAGRDHLSMAREHATAIREFIISQIAAGASAEEAAAAQDMLTGGLRTTLRQAGITEGEITALIRTYGRVPDDVMTDLEADASQARREIGAAVGYATANWANRTFTANIGANVGAAIAAIQSIGSAAGSIDYGRSSSGTGRSAPRLRDSQATGRAAPVGRSTESGASTTVNFYGDVVGNTELAERLAPAIARELGYMERGN